MTLFAATHSEAGTFHWFAAACTSIMRADAPPLRTYSCEVRMPRLPPVEKSPQTRLRFTLSPGVGYSITTFDQLHSSSSATICARPVMVPWPISERTTRMTTVSSGRSTTQAPISGEPSAARTTPGPNGSCKPSASPPPRAADPAMKVRRLIFGLRFMVAPLGFRRGVDGLAHFLERAATADVGHRRVDVRVGGLGFRLQQRGGRHDHAGLAVAALRHVVLDPGFLHLGQRAAGGEAFDGRDLAARDRTCGNR